MVLLSIRSADDKALVCSSEEGIQNTTESLGKTATNYETKINFWKTEVMKVNRNQGMCV